MSLAAQIKPELLKMSDDSLDDIARQIIEKWSDTPKAIEILHALDMCVNGALATGTITYALQMVYDEALKAEGIAHSDCVKHAFWREKK